MMSRKHYKAVAAVLRRERRFNETEYVCANCGSPEDSALDRITEALAEMFLEDNPRFDRQKFLEAAKP